MRPEDKEFMLNYLIVDDEHKNDTDSIKILRNGLEDSHWYGDEDAETFENLVRKSNALDEILEESHKHYDSYDTVEGIEYDFDSESFGEWVEEHIVYFNEDGRLP